MDNYRRGDNAAYEREALRLLHSLGGECVGFVVHLSLLPNRQMCGKFGDKHPAVWLTRLHLQSRKWKVQLSHVFRKGGGNCFHIKFNAVGNPSKYRQNYFIFSGK